MLQKRLHIVAVRGRRDCQARARGPGFADQPRDSRFQFYGSGPNRGGVLFCLEIVNRRNLFAHGSQILRVPLRQVMKDALFSAGDLQEFLVERPLPFPRQSERSECLVECLSMHLFRFGERAVHIEYQTLQGHQVLGEIRRARQHDRLAECCHR
ncbi:MAG TPA: hypothetical protein VIH88_02350 [Candidatus Acidoferrales bacterium]